ncbi:MAG: hypothetical protein KDF95_16250 [Rhodocyclaceae bacterium]|nr:hypothetical protein [Rhodocyclaceae bacterium]MCB1906500.1 hypothetical protein [Rhodocyclaceae bacterium]MCP5340424.1 hypothetical protein [Nevskiaceae bacterium]
MSETLTAEMDAAVSALGRRPGWLVLIGAATRISSFGDIPATQTTPAWSGAQFEISGLGEGGNLATGGRIVFSDPDLAWQSLHLNGGLSGVACTVWAADAGALTDPDSPVLKFDGQLDNSRARPMDAEVHVDLVPSAPGALKTPRLTIGPDTGVFRQIPAGTVMRVGQQEITVEDGRV